MRRMRNLSALSPAEAEYARDLESYSLVRDLFKDLPGGNRTAACFLVHIGYMIKWLLFWIFCAGFIIVVLRDDTLGAKSVLMVLTLIWYPGLEAALIRRIDYKIVAVAKFFVTVSVLFGAALFDL